MPPERPRRKDDTWTSEELNKALKSSKGDGSQKKRRENEASRRYVSNEVNGSEPSRRNRDGQSNNREEEDKKSRRSIDKSRQSKDRGDSPGTVALTEEEREKQRQERRLRREGKHEDKKPRSNERKLGKKSEDNDDLAERHKEGDRKSDRRHHRSEELLTKEREDERRRNKDENEVRERRHLNDTEEYQHHKKTGDDGRRPHQEDGSRSRRHRDGPSHHKRKEGLEERQVLLDDTRRSHRGEEPDDEEERQRRRQERRERREKEKSRDSEKDTEKSHRSHRRERPVNDDLRNSENKKEKNHRSRDRNETKNKENESYKKSSLGQEEEPAYRSSRSQDLGKSGQKAGVTSSLSADRARSEQDEDNDEYDDYNYDEDFEDYEDDFEEDEAENKQVKKVASEVEDVLRALEEENQRLTSASIKSTSSYSPEPSDEDRQEYQSSSKSAGRPKSFINFVAAKQRVLDGAVASKARKRFDDLSRLIELDVVMYDMFDLPPVREYEMYIRSFGRSDTTQAYIQTGDDDIDRDVQTDEIESLSKWTQHPPNDDTSVGGEGLNAQASEVKQEVISKTDSDRLCQFVERVSQIFFTIFDEESKSSEEDKRNKDEKPAVSFCSSSCQLGLSDFLKGREIVALSFCQMEPNFLLSVHSLRAGDQQTAEPPLNSSSILCVWNLYQPAHPYRVCSSQMKVTCCCLSPARASLVFGGMHDGSVAVWDLRDQPSVRGSIQLEGKTHVVRFPTYNTAAVMESENHHSPVVSIVPVFSGIVGNQRDGPYTESRSGLTFQIASVEESGQINLWVLAEVADSDPAGSEVDLALSPGGKVKLLRSSSIVLSHPNKFTSTTQELKVLNFHLDPSDLNHIYAGTDFGHIIHGVRFGHKCHPLSYSTRSDSPVPVVSLDFSPFGHGYFLAGYQDGAVHLFSTTLENPIVTWTNFISGETLLSVHWSHSRPSLFFVLDDRSTIFTFDLVENGFGPVTTDKITAGSVTAMSVAGDPHLLTPGTTRPSYVVLALSSGDIQVLTLSDDLRKQQPLEEEFLASYMDRC